jgi:glycosyltransferase involved in cell wall biosynthesis
VNYRVILGLQSKFAGGVDVFSINLASGLIQRGLEARIVLTKHYEPNPYSLAYPQNIPVDQLPVSVKDTWRNRWRAMIAYLEKLSPCIYIPNNDCFYSCISPKLSDHVVVVGVLHCDEFFHYEHAARMGKYWNGIVSVSKAIAQKITLVDGHFGRRLTTIPCGIRVSTYPERDFSTKRPLRIVYAGRLIQHQKRILTIPGILEKILDANIPVEVTIIGDGEQRLEFEKACEGLIARGIVRTIGIIPNQDVLNQFEQQDVILLTSDFEGMPLCILEAMGRGCVPVVADIRSGIPELIQDGWNGFIVPSGDPAGFAQRIVTLKENALKLEGMSRNAYTTIRDHYSVEKMADHYIEFFERLFYESRTGIYRRPSGRILPPAFLNTMTWKDQLPTSFRAAGVYGKNILRHAKGFLNQTFFYE